MSKIKLPNINGVASINLEDTTSQATTLNNVLINQKNEINALNQSIANTESTHLTTGS